jgi:hypothetical protein
VERESPHRPLLLHIHPKHFNDSFMSWHLRDTSRLREVTVLGDHCEAVASRSYRFWAPNLLRHLSFNAPALRSLTIMPPSRHLFQMKDFLPLVGALRQLETLALANWAYTMADIAAIHHLTRLQNLKVILTDC